MALKLPKNLVSGNNMQNVLYLITLALAVSYIMNRQNLALVSLLVVAAGVYMFKKNVVLALGVSIVVTNLLLSMNYFRQFEGFKKGNTGGASSATRGNNLLAAMGKLGAGHVNGSKSLDGMGMNTTSGSDEKFDTSQNKSIKKTS